MFGGHGTCVANLQRIVHLHWQAQVPSKYDDQTKVRHQVNQAPRPPVEDSRIGPYLDTLREVDLQPCSEYHRSHERPLVPSIESECLCMHRELAKGPSKSEIGERGLLARNLWTTWIEEFQYQVRS